MLISFIIKICKLRNAKFANYIINNKEDFYINRKYYIIKNKRFVWFKKEKIKRNYNFGTF